MGKKVRNYLTTAEVSTQLDLSRQTIYNYIRRGLIHPTYQQVTLGGYTRYKFDPKDIMRLQQLMDEPI